MKDKIAEVRDFLLSLNLNPERTIIAFSGGKDSIVVAHIAASLGIKKAVCDNSFWFDTHQEDTEAIAKIIGLDVAYIDRFGDSYVLTHPKWLFPKTKDQAPLYGARQQKTVKGYTKQVGATDIIYGRRTQENNVSDRHYFTADGIHQIHPIREWLAEDVWGYMKYYSLPTPRIYSNPIGKLEGSTPWALIDKSLHKEPIGQVIKTFCPKTWERLIVQKILT
jgi:predicted phosphoadenosine phosphosulfate sulfurtransferase